MKHKDKIIELRNNGKTYNEIKSELGCSKGTISCYCKGTTINKPQIKRPKSIRKKKEYKTETINCIICNMPFERRLEYRYDKMFCSGKCAAIYSNNNRYEDYIREWKLGNVSGGKGVETGHGIVSNHVRKYIFKKYNNKCAKCGWSEINIFTNTTPLEIEHIDGDSTNHTEENLTLLCPNCHSLTAGHSTSKGNGRRYYREKYHKEKVG